VEGRRLHRRPRNLPDAWTALTRWPTALIMKSRSGNGRPDMDITIAKAIAGFNARRPAGALHRPVGRTDATAFLA